MKTIAIFLHLSSMPFKLDIKNMSAHLESEMEIDDPMGYLGKVIAANDDSPFAILFAYKDSAQPKIEVPISKITTILGQAAISFGGWECWDTLRYEFQIHELKEDDAPELYASLIKNLKLENY